MEYPRIIQMLVKRFTGRISEAERQALDRWLEAGDNREQAEQLRRTWDLSGRYKAGSEPDVEAGLQRLRNRMHEQESPRRLGRRRWLTRAAAVLFIGVLAYFGWRSLPDAGPAAVVLTTGSGEHREHRLPDGSVAILNENSRLSYASDWKNQDRRAVELTGEAFFRVVPNAGRPFVVLTARTQVRVLGTSFNVRAYPSERATEVAVVEGVVALELLDAGRQPLTLRASDKGILEHDGPAYREENAGVNARAWQTKTLRFRKTPLREVVRSLDHYFGVRLQLEDDSLANCTFVYREARREDLRQMLDALAVSLGAELVQNEPNRYTLHGGSCRR